MSFTRFHDDPARIQKRNLETSHLNDYIFNVPGNLNGAHPLYINDPHIRLQRTGMQQRTDMVGIDSMLRNMDRKLNRDNVKLNDYTDSFNPDSRIVKTMQIDDVLTSETRTTHPVFEYREKQTHREDFPLFNPQEHVSIPFLHNLDTNLLEKDHYNLRTYKKI